MRNQNRAAFQGKPEAMATDWCRTRHRTPGGSGIRRKGAQSTESYTYESRGATQMPSEYAKSLGARLRAIRTQQGLSLHGVEEKSRGRWKAVVVGSYERGDRAVTVQKLAELADFYGVPVSELLPGGAAPSPLGPTPKLVIDLERLASLPKEKAGALARYAATIQSQRGDYNGKVLSIRQEDLRSLAVIYDKSPSELTEELISWGVLDAEARRAVEAF
ncbi:hypothetical protein GCM10012278_37200 [Nonomuraea glycinis]|uniref:HTH cro/C1-type domain-containing protein n=2 Tax=Nonomuraea glycinis TaxID=2047744 RepID=A0A918E4Y9_9ACTN|nr:hypothetical protein GCM10012278_37200 [Nonomuraea glycinis]